MRAGRNLRLGEARLVILLGGFLVACSGGSTDATNPSATDVPATVPPASAPAQAPPTPTPTPFVPPTVAMFEPAGSAVSTWDLVALGDSNVAGSGIPPDMFNPVLAFPGQYAGLLAREQGVRVALHSYYPWQHWNDWRTVAEWLQVLRDDPSMRADVAKARIVIVLVGFHDVGPIFFGSCPGDWETQKACFEAATDPMKAAYQNLFAEIRSLAPANAVVLAADYWMPAAIHDELEGDPDRVDKMEVRFAVWIRYLAEAAAGHGALVVPTNSTLNEPDGRPRHDWTQISSDGWHLNSAGAAIVAEAFIAGDGIDPPK